MATTRIDNVRLEILRWAFQRVGYSEENAVETFPNYRIDCLEPRSQPSVSCRLCVYVLRTVWLSVLAAGTHRDNSFSHV